MVKEDGYHTVSGITERVIQTEVDLSSLNRLVCGGAQLCCIITTDSLDIERRNTFSSAYRRLLAAQYVRLLLFKTNKHEIIGLSVYFFYKF